METNAKKIIRDGKEVHVCPKCDGENFKFVAHMDGRDYYKDIYNCNVCGEVISVKHTRNKASRAYWDD